MSEVREREAAVVSHDEVIGELDAVFRRADVRATSGLHDGSRRRDLKAGESVIYVRKRETEGSPTSVLAIINPHVGMTGSLTQLLVSGYGVIGRFIRTREDKVFPIGTCLEIRFVLNEKTGFVKGCFAASGSTGRFNLTYEAFWKLLTVSEALQPMPRVGMGAKVAGWLGKLADWLGVDSAIQISGKH